jgi:tyrosinase
MNIALDTFRMPYWDAAAISPAGTSSYPSILQVKIVEVEMPTGGVTAKIDVPNPLYMYTFHPIPNDDFDSEPWTLWNSSKRFPTTMDEKAESQNRQVGDFLDKNWKNFQQRTYQMLGLQEKYLDISNNMAEKTSKSAIPDSLESVHDTLHNTIGDGGHMQNAAYSAFDPIFWLLHT